MGPMPLVLHGREVGSPPLHEASCPESLVFSRRAWAFGQAGRHSLHSLCHGLHTGTCHCWPGAPVFFQEWLELCLTDPWILFSTIQGAERQCLKTLEVVRRGGFNPLVSWGHFLDPPQRPVPSWLLSLSVPSFLWPAARHAAQRSL